MDYVPLRLRKQVEWHLANYRRAQQILEEVCRVNRELLRRREKM
jgi:hypothetical protein